MLYAIFCYDSEQTVGAWTKEEDEAAMVKPAAVQQTLSRAGKLGPVARLMPTKTARTLRKGRHTVVLDGPFAETKEQLLGFFIVECASMEEAVEAARELGMASSSNGAYEVRPVAIFNPLPGGHTAGENP